MITALLQRYLLRRCIRRGLQIAADCRVIGVPHFGPEPWLISIGRHVTISSGVTFINHDGGTWVFRDQPKYRDVIKFGRITIHDNCFIGFGSTLLPGVTIGRRCAIKRCILDENCVIPDGMQIGMDAVLDAKRFFVTKRGVVLVTRDMLRGLS